MASKDFNQTHWGTRPAGRSRGKTIEIERLRKSTMSTEERINYTQLTRATFLPTRYLNEDVLREMGILNEVMAILRQLGLHNFCKIKAPTYPDLAREFFATVEVVYTSKRNPDPNLGNVTFKVNNKLYEISIEDFCGVYTLEHKSFAKFKPFSNLQDFWDVVASGNVTKSPKMSLIRYPPLCIVAKFLANTIFARKECGSIKTGEFAFFFKGIYGDLVTRDEHRLLNYIGGDVNVGCILANSMTMIRKMKAKEPICYMGGLVTPLLEYVELDMTAFDMLGTMDSINKQYLMRCDTLVKTNGPEYIYRYWHSNTERYEMRLPNQEYTVLTRANVRFEHYIRRFLAEGANVTETRELRLNSKTWELPHLRMKKNTSQKKFLVTAYQIQDRVNRLAKKQTSFLARQFKKIKDKLKRVAGDRYGSSSEEELPEWNEAEEEYYSCAQRYEDDDDDGAEDEEFDEDFDDDDGAGTSAP